MKKLVLWILTAVFVVSPVGSMSQVVAAENSVTADATISQETIATGDATKTSESEPEEEQSTKTASVLDTINKIYQESFALLLESGDIYGLLIGEEEIQIASEVEITGNATYSSSMSLGSGVRAVGFSLIKKEDSKIPEIWLKISYAKEGQEKEGYILSDNFLSTYEEYNSWITQLKKELSGMTSKQLNLGQSSILAMSTSTFESSLIGFPESYKVQLRALHKIHPTWSFVAQITNLEWSDVISNEMVPTRNLIESTFKASWKSCLAGDYIPSTKSWVVKSDPNWVQASQSYVKYAIDPRNFLTETDIFQFELQTYDSTYQNLAGVEAILDGSFMDSKKVPGSSLTYAEAFLKIGKELNVSPYLLASRIRQEQGSGDSALISGTVSGYEGYYNYFNIEASGETRAEIIANGMAEAKSAGWNTHYKSLYGGSEKVAKKYIYRGQNTFYLQKFDVDSSYDSLYWHQYMQNVLASQRESSRVAAAYTSSGALGNKFIFRIPVYKNMPGTASAKPTKDLPKATTLSSVTSSGYNKLKITWKQVSGVTGYKIYRSTSKNGSYKLVARIKGSTTTTYKDSGLTTGTNYYYKVAVFNTFDGVDINSSRSNKISGIPMPSRSVIEKTTTVTNTSIKLTWKKVSGATGYYVYRSTSKNGTYKKVKTITSGSTLNYTDKKLKSGTTYYYKIQVYTKVSSKVFKSSSSKIAARRAVPAKTTITTIKARTGLKIRMYWTKVTGANGYEIYRSTSKTGTYSLIRNITDGTRISYTNSKLKARKTYYYKIRAYDLVNGKKVYSSNSRVVSAKAIK